MARRPAVTTRIGDPERGQLRFDTIRKAQAIRDRQFGGARRASINVRDTEVGTGKGLGFEVGFALSAEELLAIQSVPKLESALNRIVKNTGARLLRKVRAVSRRTYDTGLFSSSWTIRDDVIGGVKAGGKLRLRIELQNPAPYALYVHEAGTAPSKTIVNTYVKPLVQEAIDEILDDLTGASGALTQAMVGAILRPLARLA